ncbi:hypothetical protein C8Q77DRAFT_1222394 [Trametes polyzona]|nr:hypothetical protein C8Q77DRAFT_1222394 [Trametes polyzona]
MKSKSARKVRKTTRSECSSDVPQSAKAKQPYGKSNRAKARFNGSSRALVPIHKQPSPPPTVSTHHARLMTSREYCLRCIRKDHPDFQPRNDWDILKLACTRREGNPSQAELYTWLDEELENQLKMEGSSYEQTMKDIAEELDEEVEPTGDKPIPGDKNVFIRPIPDSEYSIRLFPGSLTDAEFCLDFVETATGKAVNSPFEYELWGVENPEIWWLTSTMVGRIQSAEVAHGIKQEDILPGEERFVLRDGQSCMLVRPGKRSLFFTVPIRSRPGVMDTSNLDVVDLPKFID